MKTDFNELAKKTLEELVVIPDSLRVEYLVNVLQRQFLNGIDHAIEKFKDGSKQ